MLEVVMDKEIQFSLLFITDDTLNTEHVISEYNAQEFIKTPTTTFRQIEGLLKAINPQSNVIGSNTKLNMGIIKCGLFVINMDTDFYITKIDTNGVTPRDTRLQYLHTCQLVFKSLARNKFNTFNIKTLAREIHPYPVYVSQAYTIDSTQEPYNEMRYLMNFLQSILIDEMG